MKPAPFEYMSPTILDAALTTLHEHGYDAKLLAGGQSLVPMMNFRLAQPALLVDLNTVAGLDGVQKTADSHLHLGSMVRQRQLERDPLIAQTAPLLHQTMPYIAHPQIRNRGTLGGSLAHADPAAELPVIMVALQARLCLQKKGSQRWVNAADFFTGIFVTALDADEMLTEVVIPPLPPRTGYAFLEMSRRHGDYAQAGVAALVTMDEKGYCTWARLVYLNAGEVPMVAEKAANMLVGKRPSADLFTAAAHTASQEEIDPASDIHATAAYKRHLADVLTVRALKKAVNSE